MYSDSEKLYFNRIGKHDSKKQFKLIWITSIKISYTYESTILFLLQLKQESKIYLRFRTSLGSLHHEQNCSNFE